MIVNMDHPFCNEIVTQIIKGKQSGEKQEGRPGMNGENGQDPKVVPRELGWAKKVEGGDYKQIPPADLVGMGIVIFKHPSIHPLS